MRSTSILLATVAVAGFAGLACEGPSARPSPAAAVVTHQPDSLHGPRYRSPVPDLDAALASLAAPDQLDDPLSARPRMNRAAVRSFVVRATTAPGVITTEIDLTLKNADAVAREARLRLPLPPGAAVVGAALHIDGQALSAAFVSRRRARDIYDQETASRRDPLLIRYRGPDWIDISLFPIPAGSERRITLQWVEPRSSGVTPFRVPILGHRGRLVARPTRVSIDGATLGQVVRPWLPVTTPGQPQANEVPQLVVAQRPGEAHGYALLRTRPQPWRTGNAVVVLDSSAAVSTEAWQQQWQTLQQLLEGLDDKTGVTILTADWLVEAIVTGQVAVSAKNHLDRLARMRPAGALDLAQAMERALDEARTMQARTLLYIGPGREALAPLPDDLRQRLRDARLTLSVIDDAPDPALAQLAWSSGGRVATGGGDSLRRLIADHERPEIAGPEVPGLQVMPRWYPLETATGDVVWIARVTGKAPAEAAPGASRDLEALWTRARIADVTTADDDLGVALRTLTPWTSLLSLDSPEAYQRWGLDGVEPVELAWGRHPWSNGAREQPDQDEKLATLGDLPSDDDDTPARAARGKDDSEVPTTQGPSLTVGNPSLTEGMDRQLLVRVLNKQLHQLAPCYARALLREPGLAGTVTVKFALTPSGQAVGARVEGLGDDRLHTCLAEAMNQMSFPKPRSCGMTIARVPLELQPRGHAEDSVMHPHLALWRQAAGVLQGSGGLSFKLERIARVLVLQGRSERYDWTPSVLAWAIVRRRLREQSEPVEAYALAATLLRDSGHPRDARRLLSEGARTLPLAVPRLLERWSLDEDAERLQRLLAQP